MFVATVCAWTGRATRRPVTTMFPSPSGLAAGSLGEIDGDGLADLQRRRLAPPFLRSKRCNLEGRSRG